MKTMDISEATASLAEYARVATAEPVIMSDGEPLMAILDINNNDLEMFSLSTVPKFMEIIRQSGQRQEKEGGISGEEMRVHPGNAHLDAARPRPQPNCHADAHCRSLLDFFGSSN